MRDENCACFGCFLVERKPGLLAFSVCVMLLFFGVFQLGQFLGETRVREEAIKSGNASYEPAAPKEFRWKKAQPLEF